MEDLPLTGDRLLTGELAKKDFLLPLLEELEDHPLPVGDTILLLFLALGAGALALRAGTTPFSRSARTFNVLNLPRGPLGCLGGISVTLSEVMKSF